MVLEKVSECGRASSIYMFLQYMLESILLKRHKYGLYHKTMNRALFEITNKAETQAPLKQVCFCSQCIFHQRVFLFHPSFQKAETDFGFLALL